MKISAVIPVYNEAAIVEDLVRRLHDLNVAEIIVVDGGSTDGTWDALQRLDPSTAQTRQSAPGRAGQMNQGALLATGDVLLFLHADTILPPAAPALIVERLDRHPDRAWGRFDVRFDCDGPILGVVTWAMNLRSALTSICTGDQAMFVRRREFLNIGGFPPTSLMEDVNLSARLKRLSRPLLIREAAMTSSRRWRTHGVWRTIVLMWQLRWLYWRGVPTSALAKRYYDNR